MAERKNRHLLEVSRALSFQMNVPKHFWADAVLTACHLINRMPSSVLRGEIPYRVLFPSRSLYNVFPRIFGCVCFVRDHRPSVTKLDPKALKCIFVGYSRTQKGYRCFSPDLNRYLVFADVTFHEFTPFYPMSVAPSVESVSDDDFLIYRVVQSDSSPVQQIARPPIEHVYTHRWRPQRELPLDSALTETVRLSPDPVTVEPSSDLDAPIALRKGKRSCTSHSISNFVNYNDLSPEHCAFVTHLESYSIPKSVSEAVGHPGWTIAMKEEMSALLHNQTWDLVPLPSGKRAIGCKWVYTIKVNPDGTLARFKARLVAKGYAQTYGIDYSDTFSPVAKLASVRLLISLASSYHWPLHQLDVKNAFLHSDLEEEVYMEQPPGFVAQGASGMVCKLKRSLYGLKQSPRAWFGRFSDVVMEFGLTRCHSDHSVFYRQSSAGIILLVVYVDDIVITGGDSAGIRTLKEFLQKRFQTKDLGGLKYFLGIEVSRCKQGIFLSQRKYVLDLLSEAGMLGAKPSETPWIRILSLQLRVVRNLLSQRGIVVLLES